MCDLVYTHIRDVWTVDLSTCGPRSADFFLDLQTDSGSLVDENLLMQPDADSVPW